MMREHMHFRRGPWRAAKIATAAIVGVILAALFALIFGFIVRALWNWLMPPLFGLGMVTYWQAFGLVVLAKLLFGSIHGSGGGRGDRWRQREQLLRAKAHRDGGTPMSDEPWAPEHWRRFREYWQAEGRTAFEGYLARKAGDPGTTNL
jgi:hypothetical protein